MRILLIVLILAAVPSAWGKDDGSSVLEEALARGPAYPGVYRDGGRVQPHEWRSARNFGEILNQKMGYSLFLMTGTEVFGTPAFDGVILDPDGQPVANFSLKTSNRSQPRVLNLLVEDAFRKMIRYSRLDAWTNALRYVSVGSRQLERNNRLMQRWLNILQPDSGRAQWLLLHLTNHEITADTIISLKAQTRNSNQTLVAIDAHTVYIFRDGEEIFGFAALEVCERALIEARDPSRRE